MLKCFLECFLKIISWIWDNISNIDSTISTIVVISGAIIPLTIRLRNYYNCLKKFGFDKQTKQSMKYYVPTRGLDIDPCDQENIDDNSGFELIPFFMEKFKDSDSQYFIILADSGMGKTTFLLNLYFKYRRKIFKKYHIVLFPLSDRKTLDEIKKIRNKQKKILLLDSFDEDSYAIEDYTNRLKDICNETEMFYKIIITCRTQFFPNSEREPKITGNIRFGVGKKNIEFEKYYILPFNDSEISMYLEKKYIHSSDREKFERAQRLVLNCPQLVVRPMLLSYIDDLIEHSEKNYDTVYEIYDQLVNKWIEREALYKNNLLHVFSEKVAEYMYNNKTIYIEAAEITNLCEKYKINLRGIEAKSRSLLNRNANGVYKFAHKSILEFFLASNAFNDEEFRKRIILNGFNGYDMLERFIREKCFDSLQEFLWDNSANLKLKKFKYLYLSKYDLSEMSFIDCDFEECIFVKTNFTSSCFDNVNFIRSNLEGAIFLQAALQDTKFNNVNLRKSEFCNAYFENTSLKGVNLERAKLEGANLKGIDLRVANLRKVSFSWAYLKGADLSGAILDETILIDTDLREASLRNVDLSKAYMFYSKSKDIFEYKYYVVDLEYDFERSLEGVDLTKANLSGLNLSNMNFQSAKFMFADLSSTLLVGANLKRVNLQKADLEGADLRCVELEGADLSGTKLNQSKWCINDAVKALPQLKTAEFKYIIVEDKDGNGSSRWYKENLLWKLKHGL